MRLNSLVLLFTSCLLLAALAHADDVGAADKQLMAANGLFQRELYDMAFDEYTAFLKAHPDHPKARDARYGIALTHYKRDQHAEAATSLAGLATDLSFDRRAEALAVIAHCYQTTRQYDKAINAIDTLLSDYNDSPHAEVAMLNRSQVLYMLDRKPQSAKAAQAFIDRFTESTRLPSAYYFLALAQFDLKQDEAAAKTLNTLISEYPESPEMLDAVLLLGRTYDRQGKLEEAGEHYQRLIDSAGSSHKAASLYTLGIALHKVKDYPRAEAQLKAVLDKFPDSEEAAPARLQLGLTQLAANKLDDARATFNDVAARDAARADEARFWHAQADIAGGAYASALTTLQSLAQKDPPVDNLEAVQFDRGVCLVSLERYEEANQHFTDLAAAYPDSAQYAEMVHYQAFALHKLERYEDSLDICQRLGRMPENAVTQAAMELAAENLFLLKNYDAAAGMYGDLIKRTEGATAARYAFRLAQCAFFSGEYKHAAKQFEALLANDNLDAALRSEATFLLGDAQLQAGDYSAAEEALATFMAGNNTASEEAQFKLALAKLRRGHTDDALAALRDVAAGHAQSSWVQRAMFEFGQLAYQQKQYDDAATVLTKLTQTAGPSDELHASARYLLGWIDFDRQNFPAAAQTFEVFITQFPEHALASDAAYQRAAAIRLSGDHEKALALLDQVITDYPGSKESAAAQYLRTVCLADLGRHDEAAKALGELVGQKRTDEDAILYDLAWTHRDTQDNDKAIGAYQQMLKAHPKSTLAPAARTELAELLYLKEQYAEAAKVLELVSVDEKAEPATWAIAKYRLGWCYSRMGEHVRAANVFQMFTHSQPNHDLAPSATYQAGVSLIDGDALPQAQELFTELREKYPNHELAAASLLKLGELAAANQQYDESTKLYETFLTNHADDSFVYLAQFGLGWAKENQQDYEAARDWYGKVIASQNGPTAARAQFQIGETWFAQKDYARAAKELLKVDIVYAYPQWSAPALVEAGRAFEQLGDAAQARRQYEQCVDRFADQREAKLARQRISELK